MEDEQWMVAEAEKGLGSGGCRDGCPGEKDVEAGTEYSAIRQCRHIGLGVGTRPISVILGAE